MSVYSDPVGIQYCSTHHGTRNEDESGHCDWQDRDLDDDRTCVFHDMHYSEPIIDTVPDEDDECAGCPDGPYEPFCENPIEVEDARLVSSLPRHPGAGRPDPTGRQERKEEET